MARQPVGLGVKRRQRRLVQGHCTPLSLRSLPHSPPGLSLSLSGRETAAATTGPGPLHAALPVLGPPKRRRRRVDIKPVDMGVKVKPVVRLENSCCTYFFLELLFVYTSTMV